MGTPAKSNIESDDTCVICLSDVTERAITAPCNHYSFDFVCLVSWLQERSTCPLCKLHIHKLTAHTNLVIGKTEVTAVQYDWRSADDYKSYNIRRTHPPREATTTTNPRNSSFFAPYGLPNRPRCTRRPFSPPVEDPALRRRREVYQRGLYSLHVGSNPYSGYRDVTPQLVTNDPTLQSRARTWIRRELRVFVFLHTELAGSSFQGSTTSSNAEFLLSYIVSILKVVDIRASNGHAENLLTEFLGREHSNLFLHELNSWLRSPYKRLDEWDEEVQYTD
jgi:hypothetical protein